MLAVLRQRNFACLWIGQIVSLIGDWMLFVALPFYIYLLTGSTFATGIMFIVQTIPRLCIGLVAGVFVDRWNRKHTMIVANLIQACVLVLLFLAHSSEWIWITYVFAFIASTVSQFFYPAQAAIIPQLVDEPHLLAANSLNSTSQEMTRLVGPFLGGLLLGLFGLNSVIIVDIFSFLFSAIMISLIILSPQLANTRNSEARTGLSTSLAKIWREWLDGLHLVKQERLVVAIFTVVGVAMISEGLIEVLINGYVKTLLHGNALVLGWLLAAQSIGGLAGSLLVTRLSKLVSPVLLISLCGLVFGGLIAIMAIIPILAVVLPLIMIVGFAMVGFYVPQFTLLQTSVVNEFRGRIFGAFNTLQATSLLIGIGLAAGLSDKVGITIMVIIDASCNLLAALLAFLLIRAAQRAISTSRADETTDTEQANLGIL